MNIAGSWYKFWAAVVEGAARRNREWIGYHALNGFQTAFAIALTADLGDGLQQRFCVGMLGAIENLIHRPLLDNAP